MIDKNISDRVGRYTESYRTTEIGVLAGWIEAGMSGAVVGLAGSGKSNLLAVLAQQPWRLNHYLRENNASVVLMLVDLNNLLNVEVVALHRLLLRAIYDARAQFDIEMQSHITAQYDLCKMVSDPFVIESEVHDLVRLSSERQMRLVFMLNRFDGFSHIATSIMVNSLRGLRDKFKAHVCYLAVMRQPITHLLNATDLGSLYELLDLNTLWLGGMTAVNSYHMIQQEMRFVFPDLEAEDVKKFFSMTGGFPALIKAGCRWWVRQKNEFPSPGWIPQLLQDGGVRYRLEAIWRGLDEDEQRGLYGFVKDAELPDEDIWKRLVEKGICVERESNREVVGLLMKGFVEMAVIPSPILLNSLRLDERSGDIYMGEKRLSGLAPLEQSFLTFLLKNSKVRFTKSEIIENVWPQADVRYGVTDDSVYQVVNSLRQRIESTPSSPRYLMTWRGKPGGYQLFPDGDGDK